MQDRLILTNREEGFIEGYARACADLIFLMTGESPCGKSYDPMTVRDGTMHSYAFDMKGGGRHHSIQDYSGIDEITATLLLETYGDIRAQGEKE